MLRPQSASAAADTCTWTGSGADAKVSTAGNWTGCDNGNAPQDGDSLVFPNGPTNKTVTVDSDMGFADITFSGSNYTVSSVGFETFGIYEGITISGNNNTLNTYLRLYPSTVSIFKHTGTGTTIGNYMVIQPLADDVDVVLDIDSDVTLPMISQTAVGGGSSMDTITKTGLGTMTLSGTAIAGVTADQGIIIEEGRWKCNSTHCLGTSSNTIILDEGGEDESAELEIAHSGTLGNPITSAATTGENGSLIFSGSPTLNGAITITDSLNIFVSGTNTANIDSAVTIADDKILTSYGADDYETNQIVYDGIISGDGGLIVDNAHVTISGMSNTYTGTTELYNAALLTVTNNNSLGGQSSSSGTTVTSGTTLDYNTSSSIGFGEPIAVAGVGLGGSYPGALVKSGQNMQVEGGITLNGDATFHNATSEAFEITSVITGNYDITLTNVEDDGGFVLQPNGNNTFKDLTAVGTQLTLVGAGDGVIPHELSLNAVDGQLSRITLSNDNMIADETFISLINDGSQEAILLNNGVVDTVGTITGSGTIRMADSDARFNIGSGDSEGEFEGTVEGYTNSQFQIVDGRWIFSGYNTDVGDGFSSYYVNGGTFVANAADTSLGFSPFSISAGVLGGTDIIGPVAAYGGTIAPGESPGCLNPDGDVAFTDEFSTLTVELDGTTVCTEYDKLAASGIVYLNGATLEIDLGFDSQVGDEFIIVEGSSIDGTFDGSADGDTVTVDTHVFRINYSSTNVTLTDVTPDDAESESTALANTGNNQFVLILIASVLIVTGLGFVSESGVGKRV